MKYRKIAKDKAGIILQEGDIIIYDNGVQLVQAVIDKINQKSREEMPEMEVFEITSNWRGLELKTHKKTISANTYRNCTLMKQKLIGDYTSKDKKLKQLAEKAFNRMEFRRRVLV